MSKILLILISLVIFAAAAAAQTGDKYKKAEFFAGYSNGQIDTGPEPELGFDDLVDERETFNGFNVAGVYNISRYVGLKADVSGHFKSQQFHLPFPNGTGTPVIGSFDTDSSLYNFLGGIQVKNNSTGRSVKPFAHALVGVGVNRIKVTNASCPAPANCTAIVGSASDRGLAAAFGGGVDIRLNGHIDFRVVQVDYNPVRIDGGTQQNFRFSIGLVFR